MKVMMRFPLQASRGARQQCRHCSINSPQLHLLVSIIIIIIIIIITIIIISTIIITTITITTITIIITMMMRGWSWF